MASAYLGPESPRPMAVISESYRHQVQRRLPSVPQAGEAFSLGGRYEERFFYLLHKYLELGTTDKLCYVGNPRDNIADRLEEAFCLLTPMRRLVPGHVHYQDTAAHTRLAVPIAHCGVEETFKRMAKEDPVSEGGGFDRILVHDGCRALTSARDAFRDMAACLAPDGVLVVVHRPAHLSTLPLAKEAHNRLTATDMSYMEIVADLQAAGLDVAWELETVPVSLPRREWLAMTRKRYPPNLAIMSDVEVADGIRELTEGVLKYEGDEVEFQDRLLFIKASHSRPENGAYPTIHRYSAGQFEPYPAQQGLKLSMALPDGFEPKVQTRVQKPPTKQSNNFLHWG